MWWMWPGQSKLIVRKKVPVHFVNHLVFRNPKAVAICGVNLLGYIHAITQKCLILVNPSLLGLLNERSVHPILVEMTEESPCPNFVACRGLMAPLSAGVTRALVPCTAWGGIAAALREGHVRRGPRRQGVRVTLVALWWARHAHGCISHVPMDVNAGGILGRGGWASVSTNAECLSCHRDVVQYAPMVDVGQRLSKREDTQVV